MSKTIIDFDRYLPVAEGGRPWGLQVTGAGCGRVRPGGTYPRAGHPPSHEFAWQTGRVLREYQVVYIRYGTGWFESHAVGRMSIEAGAVFLLFPDVWHRYRPCEDTGWEEWWVGFAGEDANRLRERGFLTPEEPVLKGVPGDLVMRAFSALLDRMRSEPYGFEPLITAVAWELISAVLGSVRRDDSRSRQHEVVRQAKVVLERHADGVPVIEELAADLGLSPGYFQQVFKQATGFTPYQYHLQIKIRHAAEILRGTDLPVKQVARILRFESVYHFSTLFKKKTGLSPAEWRRAGRAHGPDPGAD